MAYILTLMRESVALKNHFYPIKAVLRRSGQRAFDNRFPVLEVTNFSCTYTLFIINVLAE